MANLTVAYVAGIIAVSVFLARLLSPTILTFILSGRLGERNSATTWTTAARAFQRSYWPYVLRTDSMYKHGVRKDISTVTRVISLMSVLITIAGIVTPLGLYQEFVPSKAVDSPFQYLKDFSPFGYGTPTRNNLSFSRQCGGVIPPIPCPFSNSVPDGQLRPSGRTNITYPHGYDMNISQILTEIYSSGVSNNTTVSNFFDIRYRQYSTASNPEYNNGSTYETGAFRYMETLILNNAYTMVDGLIVDMVNGGIGFRNHTFPPGFEYSVTWTGDILFVEPETVYVDTNLTINFTVSASSTAGVAYAGAWWNNYYTALYYNITNYNPTYNPTNNSVRAFEYMNSFVDQGLSLPDPVNSSANLNTLQFTSNYADYLALVEIQPSGLNITGNYTPTPPLFQSPPNPWNISLTNTTEAWEACKAVEFPSYDNILNILVSCGLMHGIPQRQDNGSGLIFNDGNWSQPLYSCASTAKTTIKTVSFTYNGTDASLQNLAITDVQDKTYLSDNEIPLWGVEKPGQSYNLGEIFLIWGLISPDYADHANVSSTRQSSLYLPGFHLISIGYNLYDNLPGAEFFIYAMAVVNNVYLSSLSSLVIFQTTDYTGTISMAMWSLWQNLTTSAQRASLIPKLIWTDIAASMVVGAKGVLGPGNAAGSNTLPILVTPSALTVKIHYLFAIPAFLASLGLFLIILAAIISLVFGRKNLDRMRLHFQQLSPGRIFTTFLYNDRGGMTDRPRDWSKRMGDRMIDLSGQIPSAEMAESLLPLPGKGTTVTK
ncbi:hypothetical protein N431DRAFT_460800 [Stipitochalara longipes BDJ]|nr:hypothetical protein N431DRAFT_460800 [Stipitochalara longipes BDJ]